MRNHGNTVGLGEYTIHDLLQELVNRKVFTERFMALVLKYFK